MTTDRPRPGRDVLIVGDSVTHRSIAPLESRFARDRLQVVAHPGYAARDLLPLVRRAMAAEDRPAARLDVVALLVGYNDVRIRDRSGGVAALIDEAARFRCGVVLTVPSRPGGQAVRGEIVPSKLVDRFNDRLAVEVARHPHLHLVREWEEAVAAAPKRALLDPDGVHPNPAGARLLAEVLRTAVDRHC